MYLLYLFLCEYLPHLLTVAVLLIQVGVEILEDEVEFFRNEEHLLHLYDVGVGQFPQGLDLAQFEALFPVLVLALHFLDGDDFVGLVVECLVDSSECPISEYVYYFIFLHNSLQASRGQLLLSDNTAAQQFEMDIHKSLSLNHTHIDNFSIKSKASDNLMWQPKEDKIRKKEKTEEVGRNKAFYINGVDFHTHEIVVQRQAEILEDAYSVKGDYFYLKKGEIVNVRFSIGEYVEIKFEQKIGYFPAKLIRLIDGERWKTTKH